MDLWHIWRDTELCWKIIHFYHLNILLQIFDESMCAWSTSHIWSLSMNSKVAKCSSEAFSFINLELLNPPNLWCLFRHTSIIHTSKFMQTLCWQTLLALPHWDVKPQTLNVKLSVTECYTKCDARQSVTQSVTGHSESDRVWQNVHWGVTELQLLHQSMTIPLRDLNTPPSSNLVMGSWDQYTCHYNHLKSECREK